MWTRTVFRKVCLSFVPANSALMYRFAKRYVDRYNNDNNADMKANGEVRFLQLYLPRCETVFDIGANVGDWTALALKFNPVAAIHCFEPSGSTFELLRSRGFPANVALNNIGLSSSRREAELFVSSNNSGMNSLYARDGLEGFEVACQVRQHIVLDTVDNYCRERRIQSIDLVKMDVEGHEMEICKGMSQMLGSGGCPIRS